MEQFVAKILLVILMVDFFISAPVNEVVLSEDNEVHIELAEIKVNGFDDVLVVLVVGDTL